MIYSRTFQILVSIPTPPYRINTLIKDAPLVEVKVIHPSLPDKRQVDDATTETQNVDESEISDTVILDSDETPGVSSGNLSNKFETVTNRKDLANPANTIMLKFQIYSSRTLTI